MKKSAKIVRLEDVQKIHFYTNYMKLGDCFVREKIDDCYLINSIKIALRSNKKINSS